MHRTDNCINNLIEETQGIPLEGQQTRNRILNRALGCGLYSTGSGCLASVIGR
jgi:hypothetical protein